MNKKKQKRLKKRLRLASDAPFATRSKTELTPNGQTKGFDIRNHLIASVHTDVGRSFTPEQIGKTIYESIRFCEDNNLHLPHSNSDDDNTEYRMVECLSDGLVCFLTWHQDLRKVGVFLVLESEAKRIAYRKPVCHICDPSGASSKPNDL